MRRRLPVLFVGVLVAGLVPFVGVASARDVGPHHATATIDGKNLFVVNALGGANYRFPAAIFVAPGGTITFTNHTDDFHTITFVNKADEPTNANEANNCAVCNTVNNVYGAGPGSPPSALQTQGGVAGGGIGPDPAVTGPPPFNLTAQEIRFATPATATSTGDSAIIGFDPASPGFTARTVQAPTTPGVYRYMCTFHPWMQGKLIVGPASDH